MSVACALDDPRSTVARINGVALHAEGESLDADALRQRACGELLRQAAMQAGLLDAQDPATREGVMSEAASLAIEQLLDQALQPADPTDEEGRRFYDAHPERFQTGEQVRLRHVLFAVVPGVDVAALRDRAEVELHRLQALGAAEMDAGFQQAARALSNCPSSQRGGDLGWLGPQDCAPELAKEVFGKTDLGLLLRLVTTRFGFHIVQVAERQSGTLQPWAAVQGAVRMQLAQRAQVSALRQFLATLAEAATLEGVDFEA